MDEYHATRPDICILDIMLPSKDGYEIANELRVSDPHLPIIFLSAKALTEDIVKGFESGGNDYLKKPFSMDELLVRMEALLKRPAGLKEGVRKRTVCHSAEESPQLVRARGGAPRKT